MDRIDLSEDSIHEMGVLFEEALREVAAEMSVVELDGIERRAASGGAGGLGAGGGAGPGV